MQSDDIRTQWLCLIRFVVAPAYTRLFRGLYGEEYPDLETSLRQTSLYFVNSDPFFEYPRPTLHNIIYMGGITMEKPEPLKPDWASIMDTAEKGVVLFSLGSVVNTSTMPIEIKRSFLGAFKAYPSYTFIWRLEGEFPEAKGVPNVHLSTWIPQKDLLGHPKMKAFITHGGYNSLTEATYMGVPLIMFPLFGDQYANVVRVQRHGVGVVLDKATVSVKTVTHSLHSILDDYKVDAAARKLGRMIQKKPIGSYESAMKWTEFLAEFGPLDTLLPDSRNINFISYYMLDVLGILGAIFSLFFYLLFKLCGCCCRLCAKKPKTSFKKKRQ